jgi:hypothetical protein
MTEQFDPMERAADAIRAELTRLRAERAELVEALEPYACKCGKHRCAQFGDDYIDTNECPRQKARALLARIGGE